MKLGFKRAFSPLILRWIFLQWTFITLKYVLQGFVLNARQVSDIWALDPEGPGRAQEDTKTEVQLFSDVLCHQEKPFKGLWQGLCTLSSFYTLRRGLIIQKTTGSCVSFLPFFKYENKVLHLNSLNKSDLRAHLSNI